jgi:hypothetical protein
VKGPEWLFAHWDVDPRSLESMRKAMGERAMALSRLTLRVLDPGSGSASDIEVAGARRPSPRGGASERFRPGGASDVYRR